jgi:hypothetical protein
MDLRDKNNTLEGYKKLLEEKQNTIKEDRNNIEKLKINEKKGIQKYRIPNNEVIFNMTDSIYSEFYDIFFINYSTGKQIENIKEDYFNVINAMENVWKKDNGYVEMLNMISVGIMLEIPMSEFNKLVKLIENDNPKDFLIDLLINYKMPEWERKNKKFMWKKPYQKFEEIEILAKSNKDTAVIELKKYLQKQWLPANNTRQSRGKWFHCGYWSFESGAIVKVLKLNDTILKDINYYPYDMVHWKK